jgi:hypothetical protein
VEQEYITDEFGITRPNPNYTGPVFSPGNPYAPNAMAPYWQSVDQAAGNPQGFTQTMAAIESQGGQNLTSPTGAVGPFQFTGIAANAVGIPKDQTTDPYIAAQAASELASQNRQRFLNAYGREPNGFELYMMHQQGAGGAMVALGAEPGATINQLTPAVRNNILAQGIQGITGESLVSDFVDIFDKKYSQYQPFTGQEMQPQNSQMGGGAYYQPNYYGYGDDGFDTGFNAGGYYTGGTGNAQYQKGGSTGPQYVTDEYGITRQVQGQQSYGNNQYGYGGSYNPQAYGYQQDYGGGGDWMTGSVNTGYMSYNNSDPWGQGSGGGYNQQAYGQNAQYQPYTGGSSGYYDESGIWRWNGQPDITVYGGQSGGYGGGSQSGGYGGGGYNSADPWGMGVADGGYGNMGSEGGIAGGGTTGASDGGFTYGIGNQYFDQGQQAAQQQYNYQQNVAQQQQGQFNQNQANMSNSTYAGGGDPNTQYQPY